MKTKKPTPIQKLTIEAERYHRLAAGLAFDNLHNPDPRKEKLAREHAIRAETFRAAAKLIG